MGNAGSSEGGSAQPSSDGGMAGMSLGMQNLELPWSTSGGTMPTSGAEPRASLQSNDAGVREKEGQDSGATHSQNHTIHSNGPDAGGQESKTPAPPRGEQMAEGPLPTLSQILAKGNGTQSSVRVRLEELREMDRPSVRVTGAAARPSVRVTGAAPASQKQLDLLFELKKENERLLELKRMYALRVAGADPERFRMLKDNASRNLIPCLTRTPVTHSHSL